MNAKEYNLIAGAVARTHMVLSLDRNKVRRQAKLDGLRLVTTDLAASMAHEYPATFDHDKFYKACGLDKLA